MPFLAKPNDSDTVEPVIPEETDDDARLTCPSCDGRLSVRVSHSRTFPNGCETFVARHFVHATEATDCDGGGESTEHARMKSVALSKLLARLGKAAEVRAADVERSIGPRVADVALQFDGPLGRLGGMLPAHGRLGDRLAVEVQYRHTGKDRAAVTRDLIDAGWSVLWLDAEQFSDRDVRLFDGDGQRWVPVWPNAVPTHERPRDGADAAARRARLPPGVFDRFDDAGAYEGERRVQARFPFRWVRDDVREAVLDAARERRTTRSDEDTVWTLTDLIRDACPDAAAAFIEAAESYLAAPRNQLGHPKAAYHRDALAGERGLREQRRSALRLAYYDHLIPLGLTTHFAPGTAEALLRRVDSEYALPPTRDCMAGRGAWPDEEDGDDTDTTTGGEPA